MQAATPSKPSWTLAGKYVLITGATSGIGLAAATALAKRGAKLGIVARNRARAGEAAARIEEAAGGRIKADIFIADMASQTSIRRAAADILSKCPRIDVLINNAGALFETRQLTEDGREMTWAVNHLAPFLLTSSLLNRLLESGPARIITTASHGHKMAKKGIVFDDIDAERCYSGLRKIAGGPTLRYAETKLANILFTAELAERLKGTGVSAYCFDPGLVSTNFNQNNGRLARMTMAVMRLFSRTPEKGAETLVWLAESPDVTAHSGGYFVDMQPKLPSDAARDRQSAQRLWQISERQTGVSPT